MFKISNEKETNSLVLSVSARVSILKSYLSNSFLQIDLNIFFNQWVGIRTATNDKVLVLTIALRLFTGFLFCSCVSPSIAGNGCSSSMKSIGITLRLTPLCGRRTGTSVPKFFLLDSLSITSNTIVPS